MGDVSMAEIAAAYPALAAMASEPIRRETWLDGTATAAWLEGDLGIDYTRMHPSHQRQVRRWRNGGAARAHSLERILLAEGYQLTDVPDRLWIPFPFAATRGPTKLTPELRRQAAERYLRAPSGHRLSIAAEYGVNVKTLRAWGCLLTEGRLR